MMKELYIAIICSSNMNRSMEAHAFLAKKGFNIKSFGTGDRVRLPGPAPDRPNCYDFGTPYQDMSLDLIRKDKEYYTQNGLLNMLERNRRIKPCPERLQDSTEIFDVIITCEERVFDQVIDWFTSRNQVHNKLVHIINVDIEDNAEEATIGSFLISDIVTRLSKCHNLVKEVDDMLHLLELKTGKTILNCRMMY